MLQVAIAFLLQLIPKIKTGITIVFLHYCREKPATLTEKYQSFRKAAITMEPTEPTFYKIKRHEEYDAYLAVVLLPGSNLVVERMARETIAEVVEDMTRSYGEQAERVSSERFTEILKLRTTHSPEMLTLLSSNIMGDLRDYHVYGSYRPISAAWARIPDAVYLPVPGWQGNGYSTYVATPVPMEKGVQRSYELTFLSRPSPKAQAPQETIEG